MRFVVFDRQNRKLISQRGFGLLDVILCAGMGILAFLPVLYMTDYQAREGRRLQLRLEVNTIKNDILAALSEAESCRRTIVGRFTIDESAIADPSYFQEIDDIKESDVAASSLIARGQAISGISENVVVDRIRLVRFQKTHDDAFKFDIEVKISQGDLHLDPLVISRLRLMTSSDSAASAREPVGCTVGAFRKRQCRIVQTVSAVAGSYSNVPSPAMCDLGEEAVAGGGTCLPNSFAENQNSISFPVGLSNLPIGGPSMMSANDHENGYSILNERRVAGGVEGWIYDCVNPRWDYVYQRTQVYCCRK